MAFEYNWQSGEGVSRIDDPADADAAFERGEWPFGSAVIGLAFNCSLDEASPPGSSGQGNFMDLTGHSTDFVVVCRWGFHRED